MIVAVDELRIESPMRRPARGALVHCAPTTVATILSRAVVYLDVIVAVDARPARGAFVYEG